MKIPVISSPDLLRSCRECLTLRCAMIDTSSLVYLDRICALDLILGTFALSTIYPVIDEFGRAPAGLTILTHNPLLSNDRALIASAQHHGMAIISEDRQILRAIGKTGLPFFNSAMIVNALEAQTVVDAEAADRLRTRLKSCARYSADIWAYADSVLYLIRSERQRRIKKTESSSASSHG